MKQEDLNSITETVGGIKVKQLRWIKQDNIIVGLVQDPILGKTEINEGYIGGQWRRNGVTTNRLKDRPELNLQIDLEISK